MPIGPHSIEDVLRLELDAAASPAQVEAAAKLLRSALEATGIELDEGSVTMVVSNYATKATLRARDKAGLEACEQVVWVSEDPIQAVDDNPALKAVAAALARGARDFVRHGARIVRPGQGRPKVIAKLTTEWVEAQAAVAKSLPRKVLFGSGTLYTPILRVGKAKVGEPTMVRVILNGSNREVAIADDAIPDAFAAARTERSWAVHLRGRWIDRGEGCPVLDPGHVTVTAVRPWDPISGSEMVDRMSEHDVFDDVSTDTLLNMMGIEI